MSKASLFLSLREDISKGLNSIKTAFGGFNKAVEEAENKSKALKKAQDAENANLARCQRVLFAARKELNEFKKTYTNTNDAIEDSKFESLQVAFNAASEACSDTRKNIKELGEQIEELNGIERRSGFFGGKGGGTSNKRLLAGVEYAQLGKMFVSSLGESIGAASSSAFGDDVGNALGTVAGGIASGAATGFAAGGPWGALIGGIVGIASGAISAGTQIFEKKDQYYKNAVQETYEGIKQAKEEMVTSGSAVAAGREVDELAFNKLLGAGVGTEYLADLRDLAAHTPLEYDQLTEISRQLAIGFGDESDRMLDLIEVVGDAGSAVGLDSSGMVTIATALSRMQSSDKVTLEYLNLIQERGIDAIGLIGQAKGMTTAQVYDAISKGTLDGSDVVDILEKGMGEKYGGSMEEQSQTATGLQSTLEDQETERQNMTGENYNDARAVGWNREIGFNDSELGQQIMSIDALHGTAVAMGENLEEIYKQQALTFLHTGEGLGKEWSANAKYKIEELRGDFLDAFAEWEAEENPVEKAKLGERLANMQEVARTLGENAYEMSDYYQDLGEMDKEFLQGIQDSEAEGAYLLGYDIGKELSKGIKAGALGFSPEESNYELPPGYTIDDNGMVVETDGSSAYGLNRVPYNGYIAQLHEGERVLTAQQARQMDAAGSAGGVVITGNNFTVREDADVTRIASELVRQIRSAQMVYAG